ncbi:MAG: gspJ [Paucimonas sp.]|nr:gspJ [Paucimonas sp.]
MVNRRSIALGFTLIELLVAISIMAIVAVLGWRGLDGIVRARISLNRQLEQTRGLQLAFAQLQNDCALINNAKTVIADENRLVLVRMVITENLPSRMQVVTYRLRNGVLTRAESAPSRRVADIDAAKAAALRDENLDQGVVLQENVGAMWVLSWYVSSNGWREGVGDPQSGPLTGILFNIHLKGHPSPMAKVFLLGAG